MNQMMTCCDVMKDGQLYENEMRRPLPVGRRIGRYGHFRPNWYYRPGVPFVVGGLTGAAIANHNQPYNQGYYAQPYPYYQSSYYGPYPQTPYY